MDSDHFYKDDNAPSPVIVSQIPIPDLQRINNNQNYNDIPNLSNFETQSALNVINENNLFKDQVIEEQVRLLNELPKTDYLIMLKGEDVINYRFKISEQLKK